ncbi:MAG: hypothetical protein RML73_03975 [Anaerolineae bacterium]|nr:hypothetical protein [Anaerolineae bacterium]
MASRACLLIFVMLIAIMVSAQEDSDPLNPRTNAGANACYTGGSMDGRCEDEYLWIAGWYLIRLEHDVLRWDDLPEGYRWLRPRPVFQPQQETGQESQLIGTCYNSIDSSRSLRLSLGVKRGSFLHYTSPNCAGISEAMTIAQSAEACTALGLNPSIWNDGPFYGLPSGAYYVCNEPVGG